MILKNIQLLALSLILPFTGLAQFPKALFSASDTIGCSPLNVKFQNYSEGAVTFSWDFGDGRRSNAETPINLYIDTGTYVVRLIAKDATGNTDTTYQSISVLPDPVAEFSISEEKACAESEVNIQNLSKNAHFWVWDFGNGVISTEREPVYAWPLPGTYSINLIAKSKYGCASVIEKPAAVVIKSKPDADFTVDKTSVCSDLEQFSFTSTPIGASKYQWDFGNGEFSNDAKPLYSFNQFGIFTVSLAVTNSFGCTDTVIKKNLIKINQKQQPTIEISNTIGCPPMETVFSGKHPNAVSWNWDLGDGKVSTERNVQHVYNEGKYDIRLTITDEDGCRSQTEIKNGIRVFEVPNVNIQIAEKKTCDSLVIRPYFDKSKVAGWVWDFGDGTISKDELPVHTYFESGSHKISLQVTDTNGCMFESSINKTIEFKKPEANISADKTMGCAPLQIKFVGDTLNTGYNFTWELGNGITVNSPNPVVTYDRIGSYDVSVKVSDSLGCVDSLKIPGFVNIINPDEDQPVADTISGCIPLSMKFSDATAGGNTWHWDFGDGHTSTEREPRHIYNKPGTYLVNLNVDINGGCQKSIPVLNVIEAKGAVVDFSISDSSCSKPYIAYFNDLSVGVKRWYWEFGDGTSSTARNPMKVYDDTGSFSPSLTVESVDGCIQSVQKHNSINSQPFGGEITADTAGGSFPQLVKFNSNSAGATSWLWNFGDGTISTEENPEHVYNYPDEYFVILTIKGDSCESSYYTFPFGGGDGFGPGEKEEGDSAGTIQDSSNVLKAEFSTPWRSGCAPLEVRFANQSRGAEQWYWDFGDGNFSTEENPVHLYLDPGTYDVILISTNKSGFNDTTYSIKPIETYGPVADFSARQLVSCTHTELAVSDSSKNANYWRWSFGDGTVKTEQNPTHRYHNMRKNYVIGLTVRDTNGCSNSISRSFYAGMTKTAIVNDAQICLQDTVNFTLPDANFSNFLWDFGDGKTSEEHAPSHQYKNTGTYSVKLIAGDNNGCIYDDTLYTKVVVTVPKSQFELSSPDEGCDYLEVLTKNTSIDAYTWLWDFGDGNISTDRNPIHKYQDAGEYSLTLTAINGSCKSISNVRKITVNKATADFEIRKKNECLPVSVNFRSKSDNAVSWKWDFGDTKSSSEPSPTHVYTNKNISDISLSVTDKNGCKATISKPAIKLFTTDMSVSATEGCSPLTVEFQDSTENAVRWLWEFGDGKSSSLSSPRHQYKNGGSYDVKLIAESKDGCLDTLILNDLIKVYQPVAAVTTPFEETCAPALVTFNNLSQNASSYRWYFGDSKSSAAVHASHIYKKAGIFTISLVAMDKNGCRDSLFHDDFIKILGPEPDFEVSDTITCIGDSIFFKDLSQHVAQYQWNFGDGNISTAQSPVHYYTEEGEYTPVLLATDSLGCSIVHIMDSVIKVKPLPIATFGFEEKKGCEPLLQSFNNNSEGADKYLWKFGNDSLSAQSEPKHTYTKAGIYYPELIAISKYGCIDQYISDSSITVLPKPKANFNALETKGCSPITVKINNSSVGDSLISHHWYLNGNYYSDSLDQLITLSNPGLYDVSLNVTDSNGCTDTLVQPAYIQVYDTTPPVTEILAVTVISDDQVHLVWEPAKIDDFKSYIVSRRTDPTKEIYEQIAIISDSTITSYTDRALDTQKKVYCYKLQVVDQCDNVTGLKELNSHCTILLATNSRGSNISLQWTPYLGCENSGYEILRFDSGLTEPVSLGYVESNIHRFVDSSLLCPGNYIYLVRARELCGNEISSFSNKVLISPEYIPLPEEVEIIRSTVVNDIFVLTEWKLPKTTPEKITGYKIYRSTDNETFNYLNSVVRPATAYVDEDVDVENRNYYYRIETENICHTSSKSSNPGSSIWLKAGKKDEKIHLEWTNYEGWDTGVDKYVIEWYNPENEEWEKVKEVTGKENRIIDAVD